MRKRNVQIKLWLSDEEADVLRQDVKRTGLTQSKYLRALIMKREIYEKLPIDYYHMLTEISRIGNNLNQIAQKAHTLNVIDVQRYDAAVSQFEAAVKEITEAVVCPRPVKR